MPGPPRDVAVWTALERLPAWLDRVRRACHDPPADASKAAEWYLDNEYHIRRAVRQVRQDMPPAFYRRLARSAEPERRGAPRVFCAAHAYLERNHAQVDISTATEFMDDAQGEAGPTLAELWAFPAMLRLVCLQEIVAALLHLLPDLTSPLPPGETRRDWQARDPTEALSRAIVALAAIERIDWKAFVEATSHVEALLRTSPDGVYPAMDFETRDRYRQAVEDLAEGSGRTEPDVARTALRLCAARREQGREGHVGWWLLDGGRPALEAQLGYRPARRVLLRRLVLRWPGPAYAAALLGTGAVALALPLVLLGIRGTGMGALALWALLLAMPASIIAVTLTNWLVTQILPPRVLPKMDFLDGLPPGIDAAVIVPAILRSPEEVAPLLAQLERHMLTNPDPRLRYALLSDLPDAAEAEHPGDAALEAALVEGVRALNRRYPETAPFVLLHRRRSWNAADGVWMGWDRKRGKIEAFTDLLHGEGLDVFPLTEGDLEGLGAARLVVTLDADTVAPSWSVHRLLGALAHPLNRPQFDESGTRVVAGYTFIQPRIEISPEAGAMSHFTRLYTGDTAIDIYSRAVSDVYQDLFGEGIFTGKGAFDAAAFRRSLHGRAPENVLVSHDLFEGLHGRAALASDIVLYEGFPARYPDFARRLHRWIRGDWQLLPWLGRRVPGRGAGRVRSALSMLDRWKILDNLRRSLIAPWLVALALCGWLAIPGLAALWSLLVVAAPGTYLATYLVSGISRGRRRGTVRDRGRQFRDHAGRWALEIVFMANEAVVCLDAIARALWRQTVSGRRMMEWVTAAHVSAAGRDTRAGYWRDMAGAPGLGLAIGGGLVALAPAALPGALPLLALWVLSPEIAFRLCRPLATEAAPLPEAERTWLRAAARRTWAYFESFAGPDDNWLAPDNVQVDPDPRIAHRSSPTNVGMQLMASMTALDLGHVGLRDLAQRTAFALDALERIERHKGHPVNWVDTRTLASLEPRYVSTVDSGNLAVALVTLSEGLIEAAQGPALSPALWDGLVDTLDVLAEAAGSLPEAQTQSIRQPAGRIADRARGVRDRPMAWRETLSGMVGKDLPMLSRTLLDALDAAPGHDPAELHFWLERVRHHGESFLRDLDALCPWLAEAAWSDIADPADALAPDARLCLGEMAAPPALRTAIDEGRTARTALHARLLALADRAEAFAIGMDFRFLHDAETRTFFIGYNLSFDRMDPHRYDLLASEARLASLFAIAKGDVPAAHWFHLGRPISRSSGPLTVLSWNGSMFEYLMPALLVRSAPGQLLGQSERAAVEIQRRYGARLGLPWGVSEAAFAARDAGQTYQYRAFGVAGLGLRQGLNEDYVVAPYASALALAVAPEAAVRNLRLLAEMGIRGRYGFFDAVDFTPSRAAEAGGHVPVRTFMAHHQGMLLSAIGNALCGDPFVRRFNRHPRVAAIDLLLHERVPWEFVPEPLPDAGLSLPEQGARPVPALHGWAAEETGAQIHTLGNGRLSLWVSEAGRGSLWWHGQSLTRWDADPLQRDGSAQVFLSDVDAGRSWDFRRRPGTWVDVRFHAEAASFHIQDHGLAATQEICVAAADDVEIRRITLVNHGDTPRVIEVTSMAEPVLAPHAAHERHPAFSKLFVRSEILPETGALLFTRRPRHPEDTPPVMLHRLLCEDEGAVQAGAETDRRALLGRHGRSENAATAPMTASAGFTLDPVAALRGRVTLAPGARARVAFLTFAAASRETALETMGRYAASAAIDWAFGDATRAAAVEAERASLGQSNLEEAQRLAGEILRPGARAPADGVTPLPGQPDLWGLGLSGDLPIVLVRVADGENAALLPRIVRAQRWLGRHGLRFDLVVLGARASSYEAPIAASLRDALREAGLAEGLGGDGGVHLHSVDRIAPHQLRALERLARLSLDGAAETLAAALPAPPAAPVKPPLFAPGGASATAPPAPLDRNGDLVFDNGLGGFAPGSGDYAIHLGPGATTPVPWCNVLANDGFGTIVTEAGLGFTWALNSGEFRLTPWSNDPVTDAQGEAIWLRDEETGQVWSITPLPAGDGTACRVTHKAGETVWARVSQGLVQRLSVTVPDEAPVKLMRLALTNTTDRPRRITATAYAEWQLGATPSVARPHVACGFHGPARALIAQSGWAPAFAGRIAFLTASRPVHAMTADRAAFLGEGSMARPEGLQRWGPWGRVDAVEDACAVCQVHLDVAPGATEEVVFVLGAGDGLEEVETLARTFTAPERAQEAARAVGATWQARLGALQVETPDPALDLMVNRWLPYQAFAARIEARAGFQQASGGIGFRDQLQDMLAFLISEPGRVRAHLLDCARHQFEEGDVLHWWHPPEGRGVRTRCSDDMLWLVHATHAYVRATGDTGVLEEEAPFLTAPPLSPDEEDRYAAFPEGPRATLLEHCLRAMRRGATAGAHGLPLIGAGDWNDGMDRIGRHGRGESVWLAWFAASCADAVADLADRAGRGEDARHWQARSDAMRTAAEVAGWDGAWYRRAFDDDGVPWGSAENEECRIDSIAQSWAVLSGAPDRGRAEAAVRAAARHLIDPGHRLVRLLTPPFDATPRDPGYIRAYPPGIRENGGQYTHAATWLGMAFARLGDGDAAWRIFDLINPIRRSATPGDMQRYRGEPYVMPADIGGAPPFEGRAGWTWYTGAAGWAWRLAVEGILGLEMRDGALRIAPCLPSDWSGYRARLQGPAGAIDVEIRQVARTTATVDATARSEDGAFLVGFPTDGSSRSVEIEAVRGSPDEAAMRTVRH